MTHDPSAVRMLGASKGTHRCGHNRTSQPSCQLPAGHGCLHHTNRLTRQPEWHRKAMLQGRILTCRVLQRPQLSTVDCMKQWREYLPGRS